MKKEYLGDSVYATFDEFIEDFKHELHARWGWSDVFAAIDLMRVAYRAGAKHQLALKEKEEVENKIAANQLRND